MLPHQMFGLVDCFRRLDISSAGVRREVGGLTIRDTADWQSALLWLGSDRALSFVE
jgi:hypothetical protein